MRQRFRYAYLVAAAAAADLLLVWTLLRRARSAVRAGVAAGHRGGFVPGVTS